MQSFVIISDTSCGLEKEFREKYGIEYVNMYYCFDQKTIPATIDYEEVSAKEFYDMMRAGKRITTAQITATDYREAFEKALANGQDVLSLSTPEVISNSVNVSRLVRDELLKKYPERKIYCIDALNSCYGLGMLVLKAAMLREEGKDIDEVVKWVQDNALNIHQVGSVESLEYLKRAGRVSAAKAFFGGLLNVKPIIISDVKGRNAVIGKVKGRKVSIDKCIELFKQDYVAGVIDYVFISHADCYEEAQYIKQEIEKFVSPEVTVHIGYVVSPIGASVGPGMFGIYYYGEKVTYDAESK